VLKNPARLLVVDDNKDVLIAAKMLLKQHYVEVITEDNPHNLPSLMAQKHFQVILLDMNFTRDSISGDEGFYWLRKIKELDPAVVVILITAFGDVNTAVDAVKAGATDFVLKPWQNQKLLTTLSSAVSLNKSNVENDRLSQIQSTIRHDTDQQYQNFIATSPSMKQVFETIEKAAKTDANVLILGESGTGKELVARELHRQSLRHKEIFLSVDMGTIAESLFESELFGHKKGAFTDAKASRKGRFELAHGGSLFLDELGNIPMQLQGKLLTAIQNRVVTPVGDEREISMDIRLIAATNMPLYDMIREGAFRQDLLYRINTVEIHIPPLRERLQDIPLLIEHYVQLYSKKYKLVSEPLCAETLQQLCSYHWPGNIRELQHIVERAVIMADHGQLNFQLSTAKHAPSNSSEHLLSVDSLNLATIEKLAVEKALRKNTGNISHAAKELGITRTSLYRKMEKYGF
jgi:two-component system response regulator HydG